MTFFVVQQHSYGPEDVLGVYTTLKKAEKALKAAGFVPETVEENNWKDTWESKDGNLGADIVEVTLDS